MDRYIPKPYRLRSKLETIRFSITRLKGHAALHRDGGFWKKAWNDKILDYEIERTVLLVGVIKVYILETIRFSITRLKVFRPYQQQPLNLVLFSWNDKILDYEIERKRQMVRQQRQLYPWNDKILDYEIERVFFLYPQEGQVWLETIRFSITRLKVCVALCCVIKLDLSWNDKILDYEIESISPISTATVEPCLETIRFSITRLKGDSPVFPVELRQRLLETIRFSITRLKEIRTTKAPRPQAETWNDKILDYEIESWSRAV